MKIAVRNLNNETLREIELPGAVFAYPYKEHLIHLAVTAILAARRRGTHKTKLRHEVAGSGRKLWRQKGTGRARVGSIRTPLWRGGGTVHGPSPKSYEKGLSAREKRNALRSALSRKLAEERIVVLDSLDLETRKTQDLEGHLQSLGIEGKALLVDHWNNENLTLASRNNPRLKTVDAHSVNVYDVVDRPYVILSESALNRLVEVLAK